MAVAVAAAPSSLPARTWERHHDCFIPVLFQACWTAPAVGSYSLLWLRTNYGKLETDFTEAN